MRRLVHAQERPGDAAGEIERGQQHKQQRGDDDVHIVVLHHPRGFIHGLQRCHREQVGGLPVALIDAVHEDFVIHMVFFKIDDLTRIRAAVIVAVLQIRLKRFDPVQK